MPFTHSERTFALGPRRNDRASGASLSERGAMRASDIIDFLLARLAEDERDTALFYEFTCLTPSGAAAAPAWPR